MVAFAERCMADYTEDGWEDPDYRSDDRISVVDKL